MWKGRGNLIPVKLQEHLSTDTNLPGPVWLHFDSGQTTEACHETDPLPLDQGHAVQHDAVGEDESNEGPAHADEHSKEAIDHVHHTSVLWASSQWSIRILGY